MEYGKSWIDKKKSVVHSFGLIWTFSVRFLAFEISNVSRWMLFQTKKNHKKVRPQVWLVLWYWSYEIWNLTIISEIYNNQYFFCFSSINAKGSQMWFQQWFMWLVSSCPNPFQNKVRKTFLLFLLFKIDNMFFLFQAENGHYIKANQKWEKSVEM